MGSFAFLDWLELAKKTVTTFTEPEDPVAEGEEVVGKMTEPQKILYTLLKREGGSLRRARAAVLAKSVFDIAERGPEADFETVRQSEEVKEAGRLDALTDALHELFWFEVRTALGFMPMSIGVRKGFLIVRMAEEESQTPTAIGLISILRGLA